MDHYHAFIVLFNWIIRISNGHATLLVNASDSLEQVHIVHYGETIVLTCRPPDGARSVKLLKGQDPMVLLTNEDNLTRSGQNYTFVIEGLNNLDSSRYTCRWNYCGWCLWKKIWWDDEDYIQLHVVKERFEECILINGLNGIFFVGEMFQLYCPINTDITLLNVSVITGNVSTNLNTYRHPIKGAMTLIITQQNITRAFNNSRLECMIRDKDYCELLPTITVYDDLEVTVYPRTVEVTDGENVNFTCHSSPSYLQASSQWDLREGQDIISSVSILHSTDRSQRITLTFSLENMTRSDHTIECRSVLGTKEVTKIVNISVKKDEDKKITLAIGTLLFVTVMIGSACFGWWLLFRKLKGSNDRSDVDNISATSYTENTNRFSRKDFELAHNRVYEPYCFEHNYNTTIDISIHRSED